MKATNVFTNFRVQRIKIPEVYSQEPVRFNQYIWESKDGRLVPIKEFDDNHLFNTYKILVNTIIFAMDKSKHKALTSPMRRMVTLCEYHLRYIAHELYLRNIFQSESDNKYKMIDEHI